MNQELERLAKNLDAAIEKVKEWIEELKRENQIASDEFLMLHEIMSDGVTHLTNLVAIMLVFESDETKNPVLEESAMKTIKSIKDYVNFIKKEAINE